MRACHTTSMRSARPCGPATTVRLAEAAHLLKGSAQNLGAAELGRVCQTLEDAGLEEDLREVDHLLVALEEQASAAVEALCALEIPGVLAV